MAARAIWRGSISFGLVNIPIQVFSATQREVFTSFSQLCEKGHKIKYKKWCGFHFMVLESADVNIQRIGH